MLPVQQGEAWVQPVTEAYVVSIAIACTSNMDQPTGPPPSHWHQPLHHRVPTLPVRLANAKPRVQFLRMLHLHVQHMQLDLQHLAHRGANVKVS